MAGCVRAPDTNVRSSDICVRGLTVFSQLAGKIPRKAITILSNQILDARAMVTADRAYYLSLDCVLGEERQENQQEIFLPLWAKTVVG